MSHINIVFRYTTTKLTCPRNVLLSADEYTVSGSKNKYLIILRMRDSFSKLINFYLHIPINKKSYE